MKMKRCKLLWELFRAFFCIGLFTFGGGYAMISVIEDACVEKRRWITQEQMENLIVVAESTPGPIAINCATFIGHQQAGLFGAICATVGMILPSFLVIYAVSRFLDRFLEIRVVANAFKGVKFAVGILIVDAGRRMLQRMPKKPFPLLLFFASLAAMLASSFFSLRLSSVVLLLAAGAISVLASAVKREGREKP